MLQEHNLQVLDSKYLAEEKIMSKLELEIELLRSQLVLTGKKLPSSPSPDTSSCQEVHVMTHTDRESVTGGQSPQHSLSGISLSLPSSDGSIPPVDIKDSHGIEVQDLF